MSILGTHHEIDEISKNVFRQIKYSKPIAYNKAGIGIRRIVTSWKDGDINNPQIVDGALLRIKTAKNGDRKIFPIQGNDDAWFSISISRFILPMIRIMR